MFNLECAGGTNQNEDANFLLKLLWRAFGRLNRSAGRAPLVIRARISKFESSNLTAIIEILTVAIPTSVVFCRELTSALTLAIAGTFTRFGAIGVTRPAESVFSGQKIAFPARVELYSPLENTLLRSAVEIGATTKQLAEFDLKSQFQGGICIENTFSSEPFGEGIRATFPDQFCLSLRRPHRRFSGGVAAQSLVQILIIGLCCQCGFGKSCSDRHP